MTTEEAKIDRTTVASFMLQDYERIIFYLLRKLGKDLEAINVVMMQGNDRWEFKIKRPNQDYYDFKDYHVPDSIVNAAGIATPHVHAIEYQEEI